MIELELIRVFLAVAASAASAYTDWRTGMIYDWITLPIIGIGILLNILEGNYFGIALGIGIFAFGYFLYWFGKLGGGDVKLFTGLAVLLPVYSGQIFVLNVIIISSMIAAILIPAYYLSKYFLAGINWDENKMGIQKAGAAGAVLIVYFFGLFQLGFSRIEWMIPIAGLILIVLAFIAFEQGIRKRYFKKVVKLEELGEDEILGDEEIAKELGMQGKRILGEKEIQLLREKGLSTVAIYSGLPKFGPFILIGVLAALLAPNILVSFLIPI